MRTDFNGMLLYIKKLDAQLQIGSTGNTLELARKMRISTRMIQGYMKIMRRWGAKIAYSRKHRTFYYLDIGHFEIGFVQEELK